MLYLEKVKITNWDNRSKGFFFAEDSKRRKIFVHISAFKNNDVKNIIAGRGFKSFGKIVYANLSIDEIKEICGEEWIAAIEETNKGLAAFAVGAKQTVFKAVKCYIEKNNWENSQLFQELKEQYENDECSRFGMF